MKWDSNHPWCTQDGRGNCVGYHCAYCGGPSSSQGHESCWKAANEVSGTITCGLVRSAEWFATGWWLVRFYDPASSPPRVARVVVRRSAR